MVHVLIERTNSRLTSTIHQVFLTRELLSHFPAFVDTTQLEVIQRNGDIYIRTLPYVEASGLPTSTNLLYLRWMTTAASSLLQRPPVHGRQMFFGSFDFFLSGERCAQRGRRTCRPAADRKDRTADHFLFHPGRGGRGHLAPHVVSGGREIFSCAIFELPCGYFSRLWVSTDV